MIFREIRPCRTKGALEVLPAEPVDLRLDRVEEVLRASRFEVLNAGVLVVASREDIVETSIYEDGRMLVKTLDPQKAWKSAARVFEAATGTADDGTFEEYRASGRSKVKGA